MEPAHAQRRVNGHWVPVASADADKIANSQTPQMFPLVLAVWYVLCREASYKRSLTIEASDSYVSKKIGASTQNRATVRKAFAALHSLGMVTSVSGNVPGTKERETYKRTIHPTVSPLTFTSEPQKTDAGTEVN